MEIQFLHKVSDYKYPKNISLGYIFANAGSVVSEMVKNLMNIIIIYSCKNKIINRRVDR